MSRDTEKQQESRADSSPENADNVDPTVQISNTELEAIRQSASQPEITPEFLAQMDRRRAKNSPRERESTPQFAHPSIKESQDEEQDNSPTRSFDRKRINAMLKNRPAPTDAEKLASQTPSNTDQVAKDVVEESTINSPIDGNAFEHGDEDAPIASGQDAATIEEAGSDDAEENAAEETEDLNLFDDAMLHDIVFGDAASGNLEAAPKDTSSGSAPPDPDRSPDALETGLPLDDGLPDFRAEEHTPLPPSTTESRPNQASDPQMSATEYSDEPETHEKSTHPLIIVCGVIGLAGICGATAGLLVPDASFALSPVRNALVLAAGTTLLYVSIILRR